MQYEEDISKLPDTEYSQGDISLIVVGNIGRYLDNRRTPGIIIDVDYQYVIFYWKVSAFEDKDAIWEMDFEEIVNFQFNSNSKRNNYVYVMNAENTIKKYEERIIIDNRKTEFDKTNQSIDEEMQKIKKHGYLSGLCFSSIEEMYNSRLLVQESLRGYLNEIGLINEDKIISKMIVSNPYSGEILKHLWMCLAKIGLSRYENRKLKMLCNIPKEEVIVRYIISRMAFIRLLFLDSSIRQITTYRGVGSEYGWMIFPKAFSSWTTSYIVACDLAKIEDNDKTEISYLMKRKTKINEIFMTSIETVAMNQRYDEKEVLLFADPENGIF